MFSQVTRATGEVTKFKRGTNGRVAKTTYPDAGSRTIEYDAANRSSEGRAAARPRVASNSAKFQRSQGTRTSMNDVFRGVSLSKGACLGSRVLKRHLGYV